MPGEAWRCHWSPQTRGTYCPLSGKWNGTGSCLPTEHLKSALDSGSNWKLAVLVFEERGKPEYPEKNLSEQGENQQQTQPTFDAGTGNHHPCESFLGLSCFSVVLWPVAKQLSYSLLAQIPWYTSLTPLPPPQKKLCCIRIFMSQEKLQTMIMQNLGGKRGVLWDLCK